MMAASGLLLLLLLLLGASWRGLSAPPQPFSSPQDAEFTFLLPAGRRECFYQASPSNSSMEIEYQVRVRLGPAPSMPLG